MGYPAASGTTPTTGTPPVAGATPVAGTPPALGGKGGGTPTTPVAQTATPATPAYQPMGGNAFGYNMSKLAGHMDPSATLPTSQPPTTQNAPAMQNPAATGGKGGALPQEYADQLGMWNDFMSQQNGAAPTADATQATPTAGETLTEGTPAPDYAAQIKALEDKIAGMSSANSNPFADTGTKPSSQPPADIQTVKDTGSVLTDLPASYDKINNPVVSDDPNAILTDQQKADKLAADKAAADKLAADTATANASKSTTNPDYSYDTYANFDTKSLLGMTANEIKSLYASKATQAEKDVTQATADYNAALKSGDPEKVATARANLAKQKAEQASIKSDQAAASKLTTGAGKTYESADTQAARTKAAADAAQKIKDDKATAVAKKKADDAAIAQKKKDDAAAATKIKADAAAKKKADDAAIAAQKKIDAAKKKADAAALAAQKKADALAKKAVKKADGGIIHNGMSPSLLKQLNNKTSRTYK